MAEGAPAHQAGVLLSYPSIFPKPCPKKRSQTIWGWLLLQQSHTPEGHGVFPHSSQAADNVSQHQLILGEHQPRSPSGEDHEGDPSRAHRCSNAPGPSQGPSRESSRTHITGARNLRATRMVKCHVQNTLMISKWSNHFDVWLWNMRNASFFWQWEKSWLQFSYTSIVCCLEGLRGREYIYFYIYISIYLYISICLYIYIYI